MSWDYCWSCNRKCFCLRVFKTTSVSSVPHDSYSFIETMECSMFSLTDLESQIYIFAFPMRKHAQLLITSFPLDYDSWHLVLLFFLRCDLNCSPALWRRQSVTSSSMEMSSQSNALTHGGELWCHRILCCPQTSALTLTCYSCVLDFHFLLYISHIWHKVFWPFSNTSHLLYYKWSSASTVSCLKHFKHFASPLLHVIWDVLHNLPVCFSPLMT